MAAASSALVKRLVSRCSITAPSRIFHTNTAPASAKEREFVKPDEVKFDFEVPGVQQMQTAEGLNLFIDMPGLSKEDVEFRYVNKMLIVKGEDKIDEFWHEDGKGRVWCSKLQYPYEKLYNMKAIKAEMKNGVLKAFLPKIKDGDEMNIKIKDGDEIKIKINGEERSDVFEVNIE